MNSYTYKALELNGRLGNQMWQIAWQVGSAFKSNALGASAKASIKSNWEYRKFFSIPDDLFEAPSGTIIDGGQFYYQELIHWDSCRELVHSYFQPSELSMNYLKDNYPDWFFDESVNKTSIHVRAGDYLQHPTKFPIPTPKYYETAASLIDTDTKFVVFSDNLEFAKEILSGITEDKVYIDGITRPIEPSKRKGEPQDQWDMFLMTRCNQHIIGNSTFSWWGAFLAKSNAVFYPGTWFGPELEAYDSRGNDVRKSWKDGMPSDWNMIEC